MSRPSRAVAYALFGTLLGGVSLPAQENSRPSVARVERPATGAEARVTAARATRAVVPPTIDGREQDAAWRGAPVINDFRQFDPAEDVPPTFRTEARVVYDDRYLYVLVRAFDPHPDSIAALLSRRDVKTASDQLKIIIDAFHDRRTGVELAVNPAGVKRDYSMHSDNVEDPTWDGVWDAATRVDSLGWVAEFRVPFSQLRFNPGEVHEFGFGVWRDIARLNQRDAWPVFRRSINSVVSQLGTLSDIRGIAPTRRLEILPYSVAKHESYAAGPAYAMRSRITGGLDLKAGLTSSLTVDATMNPDFGQVEADPAVLNLSAFEIRFDERRPFFQEGAGMYRCAGPCEGLFYTRRIGRTPQLRTNSADPAFTNILGASKVTGRFDHGVSIGLVNAVTERVIGMSGKTIEPQTNYFVGRAVREWNDGRRQLGMQVTNVARALDPATEPILRRNATTAVLQGYMDFANDTWRLLGYVGAAHVEGSAQAIALTQTNSVHLFQRPDHEERYDPTRTALTGNAYSMQLVKRRGVVRSDTYVRYAGANMEMNDFGFVNLVNDVSIRQQIDIQPLRPTRWFRSSFSSISGESHWTTGGVPAARSVSLHTSASVDNNWSGALTLTSSDFGGVNCVSCARGGPALTQSPKFGLRVDLVGDPRPIFVPKFVWRVGTSDEGRSWYRGGEINGELRLASRFSASLGGSYDHVVNDQQWVRNFGALGHDTTHYTFARLDQNILALVARANFTATPTLSFQLYAQPFVSTGAFAQWRELADQRAPTYAARFRPFSGPAGILDDFNVKQFNSNVVIRWEYRPASTLFVVWQQGRSQGDRNLGLYDAPRDVRDLFASHPDNTFLVKLSWWFNP